MANRYGDEEEYDRPRDEDERYWHERNWGKGGGYAAGAAGMGREPFGDEWRTARSRGTGKAPKGYVRSDERIREDVCERLMYSPYDASEVEVTVTGGEVTLSGTVRHRAEKWGIEDVIEDVVGIHDIHNQIRIQRGETQQSLPFTDEPRHFHS
ncbi:BON domain-containing protein [Hyalangium rubrum]|uniref:BON domain-containing protein n=1 Tax=Hyalangium rubrum TaxID=3103134 RepID=A0ABU5H496_9BACT|nr:BON domain-containing protein [Hyalangium sp. s54d21]MDY7228289.1 BON domain-containing protein [Hyalangium sp. s54d21]